MAKAYGLCYTASMPRYTNEQISKAVVASESVAGVLRLLSIRASGGSHSHITRRIKRADIDTSHFSRQGWNKGKIFPNQRRTPESILVMRTAGRRQHHHLLKRALIETGTPYKCNECGLPPYWIGRDLTLQVDHKNNDWLDDRKENLQFLCPNCHAVKPRAVGETR